MKSIYIIDAYGRIIQAYPGGFLAFEGLTGPVAEMAETVEWTPGPEDQWLMDARFEAATGSRVGNAGMFRAVPLSLFGWRFLSC